MDTLKHRFFAPPSRFEGDIVSLPEEEARHATRVLRLSAGQEVTVIDGAGGTHRVLLKEAGRSGARGRVLESVAGLGESPRRLSIGLAIIKNRNRFETFLEKAVELGVDRIVPLETTRTERSGLRLKRAQSILVSALKQSGRSRLPELLDPRPLTTEIASWAEEHSETGGFESTADRAGLICHESAGRAERLIDVDTGSGDVHVLVGPEGGFTDDEVESAVQAGYSLVWMGARRLRAETAAIAAAAILRARMDAVPGDGE